MHAILQTPVALIEGFVFTFYLTMTRPWLLPLRDKIWLAAKDRSARPVLHDVRAIVGVTVFSPLAYWAVSTVVAFGLLIAWRTSLIAIVLDYQVILGLPQYRILTGSSAFLVMVLTVGQLFISYQKRSPWEGRWYWTLLPVLSTAPAVVASKPGRAERAPERSGRKAPRMGIRFRSRQWSRGAWQLALYQSATITMLGCFALGMADMLYDRRDLLGHSRAETALLGFAILEVVGGVFLLARAFAGAWIKVALTFVLMSMPPLSVVWFNHFKAAAPPAEYAGELHLSDDGAWLETCRTGDRYSFVIEPGAVGTESLERLQQQALAGCSKGPLCARRPLFVRVHATRHDAAPDRPFENLATELRVASVDEADADATCD